MFRIAKTYFFAAAIALIPNFVLAAVTMPLEVLGPKGTIESISLEVPNASGVTALWMQVHGLTYPNPAVALIKGSVQVNSGEWIDLTNNNTHVEEPGKNYGGIGGAFHTLKLSVPLPPGLVVNGTNTIRFRFTESDGVSAGYRVLKLNFLSGGTKIIPESEFYYDNPQTWSIPTGGDSVKGKQLWESAALKKSPLNSTMLQAHCMDCHAKNGRDLKYFNYSNKSIQKRAEFHGLSKQDGLDLAAYIRSLSVPYAPKGRPWNPPYQPGPGIDSKPLSQWAAGAGIDAVLDKDEETINYLFPGGVISADAVRPENQVAVREIPIAFQFPDWNHWLPHSHPKDRWPSFTGSDYEKQYTTVRKRFEDGFRPGPPFNSTVDAMNYLSLKEYYFVFGNDVWPSITNWTPQFSQDIYDSGLLLGVKTWEIMHEFDVENYGQVMYNPAIGNPKSWFQGYIFDISPNLHHMPAEDVKGLRGSKTFTNYSSLMWYQLQQTLTTNRWNDGQRPMDWGYTEGFLLHMSEESNSPNMGQVLNYLIRAFQIISNNQPPTQVAVGWNPGIADVGFLVYYGMQNHWGNVSQEDRKKISEALLTAWLDKNLQYEPYEYWSNLSSFGAPQRGQQGIFAPAMIPTGFMDGSGNLASRIWAMVPKFRAMGVNETLLNRIIDFAVSVNPVGAWSIIRNPAEVGEERVLMDVPYDGTSFAAGTPIQILPWVYEFENRPSKVDVVVDEDNKIGEATCPANGLCTFTWNGATPGNYKLSGRYVTSDGQISSPRRSITVTGAPGANRPPKVYIYAPYDNETIPIGSSISIIAKAFENDLGDSISKVEFFDGATLLTTLTSQNWTYQYGWVMDNLTTGTHTITAKATDSHGAQAISSAVRVNVSSSVPGKPPVVTIQPANQIVGIGDALTLAVAASGKGPLSYQWEYKASGANSFSPISGATSSQYSVSGIQNANSGDQYRCKISNTVLSGVTSKSATLTVRAIADNISPIAPGTAKIKAQIVR